MGNFEAWLEAVLGRGVVPEDPPMMGDWEELDVDMLSLLEMLREEGIKAQEKVASLVRVGFGRDTDVEVVDDWQYRYVMFIPVDTMVGLEIIEMKVGPHAEERFVRLWLPELELKRINGLDLAWALWFRKQMPRCEVYYPN